MTTAVFRHLDEALHGVARIGVVHVGAHKGQEVPDYRRARFARIVLIEPNPAVVPFLEAIPDVTVHACAAGSPGAATLHVTAWDERSSLLAPVDYLVTAQIEVPVRRLAELQVGCNVAVLDCQGSELDVLRTADLTALDALIVECCGAARYHGAAVTPEIGAYLTARGWSAAGVWCGHSSPDLVDIVWRRACE
jgi:FkbM family methyltransferase